MGRVSIAELAEAAQPRGSVNRDPCSTKVPLVNLCQEAISIIFALLTLSVNGPLITTLFMVSVQTKINTDKIIQTIMWICVDVCLCAV